MGRYKISELAQLWGCSVPTVHKRVEKEGYKTIQDLDEQNKMVKYVIIDEVENKVYNVENDVNNDDIIDVKQEKTSQVQEFVNALMTITKEHEQIMDQKNEELARYKANALLLEDKKYSEGLLIDRNKELQEENRGLKRDYKGLQRMNDYFKYGLFIAGAVIIALIVYMVTVNNTLKTFQENMNTQQEQQIEVKK